MARPALEVAEIFRDHGAAWREANRGHVSLGQLKVMSAIESCRTAALGGHVARCENGACGHTVIAYNSCRNRHCVKCQGAAARDWLTEREADLLPVPYFHVVFSLPAEIADIAYQNKAVVYDLLFRISAETMLTIAADPEHLGARIAITSVRDGWLRYTQLKTKTPVELPILPALQRTLDASPTGDLTFLVTDQGKTFTAAGFGNKFRDWCNEAGLPRCSAHGLRKASATRAAENGASATQLMAMFGWRNLSEAERYTRAAERKKPAGAALVFLKRPEAKNGT
jgi:integrase